MFLQTLYCENRLCFLFALWQRWPLIWLKLDFLLLEIIGWRSWRCQKDENIGSCYQTAFLLLLQAWTKEVRSSLANLILGIC